MDIFTLFILHFVALPPSSHLHPSHIFHLYSHSLKIFRDPKPFFKHVRMCSVEVMCGVKMKDISFNFMVFELVHICSCTVTDHAIVIFFSLSLRIQIQASSLRRVCEGSTYHWCSIVDGLSVDGGLINTRHSTLRFQS